MTEPREPDYATPAGRNLLPIASGTGAVITAALPLLEMIGVDLPDVLPDRVAAFLGAAILLGAYLYSKFKTTPLIDPRDNQGNRLVPAQRNLPPSGDPNRFLG